MNSLKYASIILWSRVRKSLAVSLAVLRKQITFYPGYVESFENRFAAYVGARYGLTFCNGTSAIEAALFAAGVQPGNEVIVPSCTFHASIDPIANSGAQPVFADIDPNTLTIDPADVQKKISERTRAIVAVHLFGMPADTTALREVIGGRDILLIEDASHAHGAKSRAGMCGSLGDIAAFSLQGNKAVAAGEGGISVCQREDYFLRMSMWGHFDRHASQFEKISAEGFKYTGLGYKRRMAPLGVLVADRDLDYLDTGNRILNEGVQKLDTLLQDIDGFRATVAQAGDRRGGFFGGYPIIIDRDDLDATMVMSALRAAGFECQGYPFALHHKLRVYSSLDYRRKLMRGEAVPENYLDPTSVLPVTESMQNKLVLLPRRYLVTLNAAKLSLLKLTLERLVGETRGVAGAV